MRYYKINSENQSITSVYNTLREIKDSLTSDVELMDYIDDTDKVLPSGEWVFTEDLLNSYIKKEFKESVNHNAKEQLNLGVQVKDLEVQLTDAQSEIDTVHAEVISLENVLAETEGTLNTTSEAKAQVEQELSKAKDSIDMYISIFEDCKENRASLYMPQITSILDSLVADIKQSGSDVKRFKEALLNG